ncbi:DUF4007 family protein [Ectobacillus antri]|uniref:DUF4007 family protein n=1 Tax=Ectobacillus antri TaxID=2486280 RepID=UPI000F5A489E|nr:DUF4007 family protein [Ectobacillus antri]
MGYGQHQSFYLRDRWLSKAIRQLKKDNRFFYDEEAFEKMGLGKNMVKSLRYWAIATGVVEETFNEERKKVHLITSFGNLIFEYDRFIRFQDTAAIIHYHMCSKREPSTAWFWFFNIMNETIATKEAIMEKFSEWVEENEKKVISMSSLKRDIECLIKLYTSGQGIEDPEEVIQSPLNKLSILEERKGIVYKKALASNNIGKTALLYILLDHKQKNEIDTVSVDELVSEKGLWGKVFNMSRANIVNALNELVTHQKYPIRFVRTNNLDLIRIPEVNSLDFLREEYTRKVEVLA